MTIKSPTRILAAACGLLAFAQYAQAQFTFPVYEPFSEYQQGEDLRAAGSSGNYWTVGNSASSSQIITAAAALSYIGLSPDPSATPMGVQGPTGVGRTAEAPFTAQTSGTIYASVLINLKSYPSGNRAIFGLTSANSGTPSPSTGSPGVWVNSSGQLLISKNNSTTPATNTTVALPLNTTHLVVISYTFIAGATTNDVINLWLDPYQLGNNAIIPAPALTITNYAAAGADSTTIQGVILYAPSSTPTMQVYYDEIRVDNNWAGVTPNSQAAGPVFGVTLTGSGSGCPGDTFPVGLSSSVSTNVYFLYTNSVSAGVAVTGTGSAITFGSESTSAIYTVVASNIFTGATAWMSNSVTISILAPPNITTQPSSVTVVTNGLASFSVVAAGNGLDYQWYKNGAGLTDGGHISGSQTPILTVSPATTADQASTTTGYYVVITNSCGSVTAISTTNALILTAPVTIVWQGGNPNTNWDLSTTLNFTNHSGVPVVFNSGENVTFDDSSTNQVVTLVGSLPPTTVNVIANQNYTFIGSGSLIGPANLNLNSPNTGETLTFSNANSFTGGTTLTSGILAVKDPNQMALGYGTVSMGGGTLWYPIKSGSATVGVTNNLNVTANSTLQFDGAGSYGLVCFGSLSGTATLTITHNLNNSAAADRLRLYGNFITSLPISVTTAGDTVEFAPYNATGFQVYNGVISGNGGRLAIHDAGDVVFNGANTINDSGTQNNGAGPTGYSLFFGGGNLGIGADSHSSSPPTIDDSPVGTGNVGIDTTGGNCSIFASGGAHTIANPFLYTSATNSVTLTFNGSNNLTLSGAFTLSGADNTGGTNRSLVVNSTSLTTLAGVVGDGGLVCGFNKAGAGTLVLSAVNTYTGPTTLGGGPLWINGQIDVGGVLVTNGFLGGTGIILGPVTNMMTGVIAPGTTAIGTLTINNNLTLGGGGLFKVNKSLTQSNDFVSVSGTLVNTGTGTINVTNLGPALVAGDKFTLFSQAVANGGAITVTGGGVEWTNRLAVDGSITVLGSGPAITFQPLSRAVAQGSTVTLMVSASTSTGVTNYQWQLNTTNINGATSNSFTIANFQATNVGPYRVVVSDGNSSVTSSNANLTLAVMPVLTTSAVSGTTLSIYIPTQVGPNYIVETTQNLANPSGWQTVTTYNGDGTIKPFSTNIANSPQLFIRVLLQ